MPPKVMFALIHNNNEQRNAYVRPKLVELGAALSKHFEVTQIEVSYQSQLVPHGIRLSLYREFIYYRLINEFYLSHSLGGRNPLKEAIGFVRHIARRYFFNAGIELALWQRKSAIEMLLTDKHISVWRWFLDSKCDLLLCCEDDVMIDEKGINDLTSLLLQRGLGMNSNAEFFDLAGGCNLGCLGLRSIQRIPSQRLNAYSPGLSNTTCSYLLTKSMAQLFYAELEKNVMLRLIGADWLMNKLFVLLSNSKSQYECFHTEPPYFIHGTVSGAYSTSII
ncbi:hypothetical protein G6693_07885 [Polynucleobacter paneuropaeus]|uniref:Glycosyltransferase family 25 protein n=1 Tax=Polynucleobacter paneuropaeus TaxID=2527775 RepID=A0AAE2YM21_9BURK|nr:hypothetical protein [Polynucleobacter paneuropaeus]